jgi:hypothetical protein
MLAGRRWLGHVNGAWRAGWFGLACDDLRLVGLKLIFLIVTRAVAVLGLSRREAWWKDAEILMLRTSLTCYFSISRRVNAAFCPCGVRSPGACLVSATHVVDHVP